MSGWFRVDREVFTGWMGDKPDVIAVYIRLLSEAAYEPTCVRVRGEWVDLKAGELVIGRQPFAERCGVSPQRLRTILKQLSDAGLINPQINPQKNRRYSHVAILSGETQTGITNRKPQGKADSNPQKSGSNQSIAGYQGEPKQKSTHRNENQPTETHETTKQTNPQNNQQGSEAGVFESYTGQGFEGVCIDRSDELNQESNPQKPPQATHRATTFKEVISNNSINAREGLHSPPDDFCPDESTLARLKINGLDVPSPIDVLAFVSHYQASPTRTKTTSWQSKFISWMVKQKQFNSIASKRGTNDANAKSTNSQRRGNAAQQMSDYIERREARAAARAGDEPTDGHAAGSLSGQFRVISQ